jgi:hypothetical protein
MLMRRRRVPKGMTSAKLRWIADYVQECDDLMAQVLTLRGADPQALEFVSGQEVQQDLRNWADALDGL